MKIVNEVSGANARADASYKELRDNPGGRGVKTFFGSISKTTFHAIIHACRTWTFQKGGR